MTTLQAVSLVEAMQGLTPEQIQEAIAKIKGAKAPAVKASAPVKPVKKSKGAAKAKRGPKPLTAAQTTYPTTLDAKTIAKIEAFDKAASAAYENGGGKEFAEFMAANPKRGASDALVLKFLDDHFPKPTYHRYQVKDKGPWIFMVAKECPRGSAVRKALTWLGFEKCGKFSPNLVHKCGVAGGRRFRTKGMPTIQEMWEEV